VASEIRAATESARFSFEPGRTQDTSRSNGDDEEECKETNVFVRNEIFQGDYADPQRNDLVVYTSTLCEDHSLSYSIPNDAERSTTGHLRRRFALPKPVG
jgi:hypothetical protein